MIPRVKRSPLLIAADAVAERHPVRPARALRRPVAHGEDHAVALPEAHDLGARLHARPLLGQHELAAGKIPSGRGEQDRDLQRKPERAVDVLMQAIVVAGAIAQQERRRPRLAGGAALRAEGRVLGRIPGRDAHRPVPAVGDRGEPRIEVAAQLADGVGQRLGEIFVLAPAKTVARHHDGRAEPRIVGIERGDRPARLRRQELWRDRRAIGVEVAFDSPPIEPIDRGRFESGRRHCAASRSMSARLRATPHR